MVVFVSVIMLLNLFHYLKVAALCGIMISTVTFPILMINFLVDLVLYQILRYMGIVVFAGDLQRIISFLVHCILKQKISCEGLITSLRHLLVFQKQIHYFQSVVFCCEVQDILASIISLVQFTKLIFCYKLSYHRTPENSRDC